MKYLLFGLLMSVTFFLAPELKAQDGMDKIRSAMVSLYTERMDLTPDQSKQFWPLHEQYETERRTINREIIHIKRKGNPEDLQRLDELEQKRFELRNRYKSRFLKVISSSQLSKMYSAEEEFRKMLIERKNRD